MLDSKLVVKLSPGRKPKHGGYTFMRTGEIAEDKIEIERYLTGLRQGYISDIAGQESNLTTGQLILLNKLITLEGTNRCVEIQAARNGAISSLDERYNARNNQIIKICLALGIDRNETGREITPQDQAEIIRADLRTDESKK